MRRDECRRVEPAARVTAITWPDKRRHEFAHLKMQMGKVPAVSRSDRRDLLTPAYLVAWVGEHLFHVSVIRLHILALARLRRGEVGGQHHHDVSPAGPAGPGAQDTPLRGLTKR